MVLLSSIISITLIARNPRSLSALNGRLEFSFLVEMNFPRPFLTSSNPFRPAINILADRFSTNQFFTSKTTATRSEGDDEHITDMSFSTLDTPKSSSARSVHSRTSSADVESTSGIPLIDFSRTPSPTPYRATSATQSEDEDESGVPISLRPLVADSSAGSSLWKIKWRDGGLGAFLFGSWTGWQVYVTIITALHITASIFLVFFNRVILMCRSSYTHDACFCR